MTVHIDLSGGVTSPRGYRAGATYAGIKTYGDDKLDLTILASDLPCTVAATFTRNRLHSASVDVNREHISDGKAQAVVINSGVASRFPRARGVVGANQPWKPRRLRAWRGSPPRGAGGVAGRE